MAADKLKPQDRGYDFPDLEMPAAPPPGAGRPSAQRSAAGQSARADANVDRFRRVAVAAETPALAPPGPSAPHPGAPASPQDYFGGGNFDAEHFGPGLGGIETDPDALPGESVDVQSYFGSSTFDPDFDGPGRGALEGAFDSAPPPGALSPELDFDQGPAPFGPVELAPAARGAGNRGASLGPAPSRAGAKVDAGSSPDAARRALGAGPLVQTARGPSAGGIGHPPDRGALRMDEVELRLFAEYGPVPKSLLLTPLYTFRVASRQRSLRAALRAIDSKLREAERQRDELLAQLFSRVRPALEADSRFADLLAPVRELDQLANERSQALARSSGEYQTRVAAFDGQIVALSTAIAQHTELLKQRNLEHDQHDEAFRRADARSKRLYIEIRSAMQLAAQAAQAAGLPHGTAPQEHASKIQMLEQQALAMRPVLDELRLPLEAANAALATTRAEIEQRQRAIFGLEEQKRGLAREFGRQLEERAAGVGQAQGKLVEALAEAGRTVLGARVPAALEDPALGALRQADQAVLELTTESEKYVRALDVYDRDSVKNGFIVLGAAIVIVLVAFAILIAL